MAIVSDINRPLGIMIDHTIYSIDNISSFSTVDNKVTNMKFISISFTHPVDGNNGMSIKYNVDIWNTLTKVFNIVNIGLDKI